MIALDTNVLVRWLVDDDVAQGDAAAQFFAELSEESRGFISLIVLAELFWVLRSSFGKTPEQAHDAVEALLASPQLEVEDEETVDLALQRARKGADFADGLIAMTSELYGCTETVSFDHQAATAFGWRLLS